MQNLYEYTDNLNSPVEAFIFKANNDRVKSHWHYFIEILYILEGTAAASCNQNHFHLHPGEMFFIPPQGIHSIYNPDKEKPLRYVVLKFDANRIHLSKDYLPKISSIFRSPDKTIHLPVVFTQKDFPNFPLHDFFMNCIHEIDEKNYGYDAFLNAGISQLMIKMLRIWRENGLEEMDSFIKEEDYSIHDILMYIDEHSQDNIHVQDLAEMCHMSYSYFAKTFRELYGQTCKEYIESVRLSKVENLLLFTNYDLTYICSETGFSDCSHLIRVFKKKYHMTPKKYRLNAR